MESGSKKIYIAKSKTHGYGLFAKRDIKKGETIFFIKGKKIKFFITDNKKAKVAGMDWIGVGKNEWRDPKNYYGSFFNHSCNPNSAIKSQLKVIALCNIKKEEEITFDYSTTEADIFWQMRCYCREKKCRKIIKSIQFLPKNIFNKYKTNIPKYYRMVYNKYNYTRFSETKDFKKNWVEFLEQK